MTEKNSPDFIPASSWVTIGKLGAPHGVQGEIKLFSLSDVPDRFKHLKKVWWICEKNGPQQLKVLSIRLAERFFLIRFQEFSSAEEVSRLTNRFLVLPQEQRGQLPEGFYFVDDIIGLNVEDETGRKIGQVIDVLKTGSNDIYEIHGEGKFEVLIPARKEYILSIDFEKKANDRPDPGSV